MADEAKICEGGDGGFIMPFKGEESLPDGIRAVIYGSFMVYFFVGVSIIADVFMGAIEVITSRRRQVSLSTGRIITVRVWNDTVANLTLMALGSSAPEILLSVTELFKRKMYAGELGPSTIVGSASFNLLVIIAVCIFVIPSTEIRRISEMEVFVVTVVFMYIAYIWLVLTVSVISPGVVSIPEAIVTLVTMVPLVYVSFLADIGQLGNFGCHRHKVEVKASEIARACELLGSFDRDTKEAIRMGFGLNPGKKKHLEHPTSSDMEDLRRMVKKHMVTKRSRAARRIEATRALTGSKRLAWNIAPTFGLRSRVSGVTGFSHNEIPVVEPKGKGTALVQFACEHQIMCEDLTTKSVMLVRSGDTSQALQVLLAILVPPPAGGVDAADRAGGESTTSVVAQSVQTSGWSSMAAAGFATQITPDKVDLLPELCFEPGEDKKVVQISRPDGAVAAKSFIVELIGAQIMEEGETAAATGAESGIKQPVEAPVVAQPARQSLAGRIRPSQVDAPKGAYAEAKKAGAMDRIGPISRTIISLSRNKGHGKLAFAFERLLIVGAPEKQNMEVMVQRVDGCTGKVSCNFRTERLTAVPGYDFTEHDGTLVFDEGVTEQFIDLEILPKSTSESKDDFLTVLEDPEGGVEFNPSNDGGLESEILTVTIGPCDLVHANARQKLARWLDDRINFDEVRLGTTEWTEQFKGAIYCNGSPEEQADASTFDWCFHIMALPWKLIFTLVPPTTYCSGWVCFWTSLFFIGALTAIIGDLAELFGCIIGLPNIVTAITFVALGTSMPDLFASKTAATQDPFADASIVNVTGSNSVNVFLGLGLPWSIGAIYWRASEWDTEWAETYPAVAERCRSEGTMEFVVESDDLGFSVSVFAGASILALAIMLSRRFAIGGELGGPFILKVVSSVTMIILWVCYIAMSSWFALRQDDADLNEGLTVCGLCIGFALIMFAVFMFFIIKEIAYGDFAATHRHHASYSADIEEEDRKNESSYAGQCEDDNIPVLSPPADGECCPSCGNLYLPDAKFCRKCGRQRDQLPTIQETGKSGPGRGSDSDAIVKKDDPPVADESSAKPETPEKLDPFDEMKAEAPPVVATEGLHVAKAADEVLAKSPQTVADETCIPAKQSPPVAMELPYDILESNGHKNGNGTTISDCPRLTDEATSADELKLETLEAPSFEESQAALCRIQALRRAGSKMAEKHGREAPPAVCSGDQAAKLQQPPLTHEMVVAETPVSPNTCCCSMKLNA